MSLTAAALQIATVKALEEAGVNAEVFDSKADPLKLKSEPLPVVIVCAIEGRRTFDALDILEASHTVDLCLDLGIAQAVTHEVQNGGVTVTVEFPDNDAGHDLTLHTLGYEILRALFCTNGPWVEIWKKLASRRGANEVPSTWQRGAVADQGVQLAITRHVLRLEVLNEPVPRATLPAVWSDLLALMDADDELNDTAKVWRALISDPTMPRWQSDRAQLGLTLEATYGLGFGPASAMVDATQAADDPEVLTTEITALDEPDGVTSPMPAKIVGDPGAATISENDGPAVTIAE